ncbi:Hypothetical protein SRAE_1000089500 [Strongyloides ratti]|uniref:Uncharacterized protein n=1 Tax=Strongyloides ratti TaxID=34506 RepID=A0A090KYN4_STRRB|nr:Hypothetical protein SRAE_1000089500 [Strongyloides ratti]CEF62625.1 Hypothetical protein SRAE_1000089500 [Strongyloides ratti]
MFDQNLSLIQPGGYFNIIWFFGDPLKKKFKLKQKKEIDDRELSFVISQLQPYIFNLREGVQYDKTFALPLNVAYRLVYGTLECINFLLDGMEKKLNDMTSVEVNFLQKDKQFEISGHRISSVLLGHEDETGEIEGTVVRRKRKYKSTIFDDHETDDVFDEQIDLNFKNLEICESFIENPIDNTCHSRFTTTMGQTEDIGDRSKRKREFTEIFDIISEVGRTNENVIEVAREAFSSNPILSNAFEKRISGAFEELDKCYDLILDDKAAQTELYLQKLKLVDQNVINNECIAQISRQFGRRFSIRADTTVPSDIYNELTSIVQGKSTIFAPPSTLQITREEECEQMDFTAPNVQELSFVPGVSEMSFKELNVPEIREVTLENPIVPSPGRETSIQRETTALHVSEHAITSPNQLNKELSPIIQGPAKKRRVHGTSRPRQPRQHVPSSLDAISSMETLEEILHFFNNRRASSSQKIARKIKLISTFCKNLLNTLTKQRENIDMHEYMQSAFWFRSIEDVAEKVYKNNGCLVDMFEKLQTLPFVNNENGFIIESEYKDELKNVLYNLKISNVDYALYAAIVDMPIIGLCNDLYNRNIIRKWLNVDWLNETSSQMSFLSDYAGPSGRSYNFLPKCLPKSFTYPDFTHSLRTLNRPYEKLKYFFLKKMGLDRDLYHRNNKGCAKKTMKFVINDLKNWNINENLRIIEKMIKDVVFSDNLLTSKFYSLQSLEDKRDVTKKVVNTFAYNPNGTIVWSDLTLFVDSLMKVYCEDEDDENVESINIKQFVNELYCPSQRKTFFQEAVKPVEFESRLQEIHNSLVSLYGEPENYFYSESNEKVISQFEQIMPMLVEDETSIDDEFDMETIVDDLDTFELNLFLGYICTVSVVEEEPQERTFNNVKSLYETFINNEEDLRTKFYAGTQILVPSKWEEILTSYSRKDRKRPNAESPSTEEKSKRQRVSLSLPPIPEEDFFIDEDDGRLEEVSVLPHIEEVREVEGSVIGKSQSSIDSITFNIFPNSANGGLSEYSNESITLTRFDEGPVIEEVPKESELSSLLPLTAGQEKEWADKTLPLPDISHEQQPHEISEAILMSSSTLQTNVVNEKRKEIEELLKRPDVIPEYQFVFSRTNFRYEDENKNVITENEYLKNAAHQIGSIQSYDEDDNDASSEDDARLGISDYFKDFSLNNCMDTSLLTYEKVKRVAGASGRTTFKEVVKESPIRSFVAKTFYNMILLSRESKYLNICQKDLGDIKIIVKDSPDDE